MKRARIAIFLFVVGAMFLLAFIRNYRDCRRAGYSKIYCALDFMREDDNP